MIWKSTASNLIVHQSLCFVRHVLRNSVATPPCIISPKLEPIVVGEQLGTSSTRPKDCYCGSVGGRRREDAVAFVNASSSEDPHTWDPDQRSRGRVDRTCEGGDVRLTVYLLHNEAILELTLLWFDSFTNHRSRGRGGSHVFHNKAQNPNHGKAHKDATPEAQRRFRTSAGFPLDERLLVIVHLLGCLTSATNTIRSPLRCHVCDS